jgi:putative component of membrane protein insertase Oxa1/YidC/SpoIIIJ protein YidD
MQSIQPGIISIGMAKTRPVIDFLETIGLQNFTNSIAHKGISDYQRYVSPYKGFRCAHHKLHGGTSCSGHFRELLSQHGFAQALQLFPQRLVECREAYLVLRMQAENSELPESTSAEPEATSDPEKGTQNDHESTENPCWVNGCEALGSSGCNPDFSLLDFNHNGACDLGDCGIGSIEFCDLGFCDCNF